MVPVIASPSQLPARGDPPALDRSEAIPAADGRHLRHRDGGTDTQLLILDDPAPGVPLVALVPLDLDALDRLEEVERLWRALYGRIVPADTRLTRQQRGKLRLMLQAADGRARNATTRDIAQALYGPARVADHPWKSSPWRARVSRLLKDGTAMIEGGYRKLLRRHPRS